VAERLGEYTHYATSELYYSGFQTVVRERLAGLRHTHFLSNESKVSTILLPFGCILLFYRPHSRILDTGLYFQRQPPTLNFDLFNKRVKPLKFLNKMLSVLKTLSFISTKLRFNFIWVQQEIRFSH